MSQFYLIVLTATGCPACDTFKRNELDNFQNALKQFSNVKIIFINLPSINADIPTTLPENLRKSVVAFPSFILVKAPIFNASTPFKPENVRVFGYIYPIEGSKFIKNTEMTAARNTNNLIKWIQYVVSDERGVRPEYDTVKSNIRSPNQKYDPTTAPHPGKLFGGTPPGQPYQPVSGPGPSLQQVRQQQNVVRNTNGYSYMIPGQNRNNFGYSSPGGY